MSDKDDCELGDDGAAAIHRRNPADAEPVRDEASTNPFDPDRLRISQDFGAGLGIKKLLTTVPVRKPTKEQYFRVTPDRNYHLLTGLIELKEERELYLVAPELRDALIGESTFSPRLLVTAITRQDVLFLWPLRIPGEGERQDDWSRSAYEAMELATKKWVRMQANMSLQAYDVSYAASELSEPTWPELRFDEVLKIAFRDKYIDSHDHAVLRRLRGEL